MKTKVTNKGAAMISVLIAVMFIGVLATSLLYMAYMNYISKSLRYSSTDNFYTAEYALADLSTSLQNIAAQYSSLSEGAGHVKSSVGYTTANGVDQYTLDAVKKLITNASQEADIEVTFSEKYDTNRDDVPEIDCYEEKDGGIILHGVRITSKTSTGYISTISTDISVKFNSIETNMDVNDFSVICDNPLYIKNQTVIWGGNVYINRNSSFDEITSNDHNRDALTIDEGGSAFIMKSSIIAGNIVLKNNGMLTITAPLTVYGNIYMEPGSTLVVSDQVVMSGRVCGTTLSDATTGVCLMDKNATGVSNITQNKTLQPTGIDKDCLAHALLVSVPIYDNTTKTWHDYKFSDYEGCSEWNHKDGISAVANGETYLVRVAYDINNIFNSSSGVNNSLVMTTKNIDVYYTVTNSTLLTEGTIQYVGQSNSTSTTMSHLSDEAYEACKNVLIPDNKVSIPYTYTSTWWSGIQYADAHFYGNRGQLKTSVGGDVVYPLDGYKENVNYYSKAVGTSGSFGSDQNIVYYDIATDKNYITYGDFINSQSASIISTAFNANMGDVSPKNSYIVYSNWDKE